MYARGGIVDLRGLIACMLAPVLALLATVALAAGPTADRPSLAAVPTADRPSLVAAPTAARPSLAVLAEAASSITTEVLKAGLDAYDCAAQRGDISRPSLVIVDYSRPSLEERLWILDLANGSVARMAVAHGQGSGELLATQFSNREGSNQTSLGLFRGGEVYVGSHGRSVRLDGLEPGINDRARDRAIVVHAADYATLGWGLLHGRLGRSWGCPAVAPDHIGLLIEAIQDGGALFGWYPDEHWLAESRYLRCSSPPLDG